MRSLVALPALLICFQANAYLTAKRDKPDPYARRHYTAADLPSAKHAKKNAKSGLPSDDEIAAEIARENAGAAAHTPPSATPMKAPKKTASVAKPETATTEPAHETLSRKPAVSSMRPQIAVCKIPPKPASEQRFLISDSDGFEACNEHGGQVTAGNDEDRSLTNVKDASELKRSKK